ncbi:MAG: hypothetical protein Q4C91_09125 [Eubacteriales bacterium]|nr:hypothetical protein [Eubacteriales bacterium]
MQNQNVVSIDYFKDKERFADFLNGYFYSGQEIIRQEDIHEVNPVLSRTWKGGSSFLTNVNIMDLMSEVSVECQVLLIALQNQTDIHYAMPIRLMNQDAISYYNQWKEIQKIHKHAKDLKAGGEYLSGFARTDRLKPVVSIVIYFGREPWDGARSLKELMNLAGWPENIREMIADYSINLFEVCTCSTLEVFRTDIQEVFGFLQNVEDKERLEKYVGEHREAFSDMAEDAYDLLSVMSHTEKLKELKKINKKPGGKYNMSKAINDMIKEGMEQGMKQGIQQGLNENRINRLNQMLLEDNRTGDLNRSIVDSRFQMELLEEYAL